CRPRGGPRGSRAARTAAARAPPSRRPGAFSLHPPPPREPMTTALVVAVSVLGTLAVVLTVALVRGRRVQAPAAAPEPQPAVEAPPAAPEPAPSRLDHGLHEAAARAGEPPRPAEPPPRATAAPNGPTGSRELEALLTRALETARAIPGADAALVSVTLDGEPFAG